jgi:Mrp family chromosome partitioning ATPase
MFTKKVFIDECRRVAAEFDVMRKAEGSTVDLARGYYADVGESAWSTIWQAIEDKQNGRRVMRVVTAAAGSGKTTHAQIAAVALVRLGGTALLVVNQIAGRLFPGRLCPPCRLPSSSDREGRCPECRALKRRRGKCEM